MDRGTILQIFGSLMQNPGLLAQKEKYSLSPEDFQERLDRLIFVSIHNLYQKGAKSISVVDVDTYLDTNADSKLLFERENGISYLTDAIEYSNPENFSFYYTRLKKFNALKDLQKIGVDTSFLYSEDLIETNAKEINERFEEMEVVDLFDSVDKRILPLEVKYGAGDTSETIAANDGIKDLIESLKLSPDIGAPLQGDYFNTVCRGARKGKYYIRSASSGTGKTRAMVGDACHLAYPVRFNTETWEWEVRGSAEKTLFIMTEQEEEELQTLIVSYLTGIPEDKILYANYTPAEEDVIKQAFRVMEEFSENLMLVQMPTPTIGKIQSIVRSNVNMHNIENVFFDYIFVNPSLFGEFRGTNLRNDELLLLMSSALKDLAVELGIFVMTATQLSPKEGSDGEIKDERNIRGSKAIIDKADVGVILSTILQSEKQMLEELNPGGTIPNQVLDVFKVRRGQYNRVRIWMHNDLATGRREDLFMTDASMNYIKNVSTIQYKIEPKLYNHLQVFTKQLNEELASGF